jgi:hypothetical protein
MFLNAYSSTEVGHRYGLDIMQIESFDKSLPLSSSQYTSLTQMVLTNTWNGMSVPGFHDLLAATSKLQGMTSN